MPTDRTRVDRHKLKPMKFHTNTRKHFFTVREVKLNMPAEQESALCPGGQEGQEHPGLYQE